MDKAAWSLLLLESAKSLPAIAPCATSGSQAGLSVTDVEVIMLFCDVCAALRQANMDCSCRVAFERLKAASTAVDEAKVKVRNLQREVCTHTS